MYELQCAYVIVKCNSNKLFTKITEIVHNKHIIASMR